MFERVERLVVYRSLTCFFFHIHIVYAAIHFIHFIRDFFRLIFLQIDANRSTNSKSENTFHYYQFIAFISGNY